MYNLEGKVVQVKLKQKIIMNGLGYTYETEGLYFYIKNNQKGADFSIPIRGIPNNPIEEKRLQEELIGKEVVYEKEKYTLGKTHPQQKQILSINSGKLKGLKLEYSGDIIKED